jgi:hypothetical protein
LLNWPYHEYLHDHPAPHGFQYLFALIERIFTRFD